MSDPRINPPDDGFDDWLEENCDNLGIGFYELTGSLPTADRQMWDHYVLKRWNEHLDMVEAGGDPDRFRDDV